MVFAAVIAALYFVIARGLWLLRNWARIAVIVLQGLGVLGSLFQIPNSSSGLSLIAAVLGLAIGASILFWFASHGEYWNTTAQVRVSRPISSEADAAIVALDWCGFHCRNGS